MIKKVFLVLLVIIVVFAIVVSMRPNDFKVVRSATIKAPAEKIFAHVNDLHKWDAWSPWAKIDPNAKTTFEGPASGVGAVMTWSGNNELGEGKMTITDSRPNDLIQFRLDFIRPFAGTNSAEFTFKPSADQTEVNWNMSGQYNFITKAVGLFLNCDKLVGDQFEKGLTQLKNIVESGK